MSSNSESSFRILQRFFQAALEALFPPRCPGCGQPGEVWCSRCHARLTRCPLDRNFRRGATSNRGIEDSPVIRSYALYRAPLIKAILELKYRPNQALGRVMADWLASMYRPLGWQAELVAPVPLSVARQRQRGYNQVELISSPLAEALNLPHYRNALKRVRDTGSQVGRDYTARMTNVEGAFKANPEYCDRKVILLVDDLVTTGATVRACSAACFAAGAADVFALTVGQASGK